MVSNDSIKKEKYRKILKNYIVVIIPIILIMVAGIVYKIENNKISADRELNRLVGTKDTVNVSIQTDKGEIVVAIKPDLMPITVKNFVKLINMKFYDGLTFHRVEDWVIQGGDPKGDGSGGPGWKIKLETSDKLKNVKYCIAMARGEDYDSAGSQFYILKKDSSSLDGDYAVFGNVIKGKEVVDKIQKGDKIKTIRIIE